MKQVISLLGASFDYVSILSTDSVGWRIAIGQRSKAVTNSTMTTERGCVIRVCRDGLYGEYAFNHFDPEHPEQIAQDAMAAFRAQRELLSLTGTRPYATPALPDEPCDL